MSGKGYCVTCGAALGASKFCGKCGTSVDDAAPEGAGDTSMYSMATPSASVAKGASITSMGTEKAALPSSNAAVWGTSGQVAAKKIKQPKETKKQPVEPIVEGIKKLYKEKVLPLEGIYQFPSFHSPSMTPTDFDARPMVMLIGQYSTGKTSFIRYLLERDFPDMRIGPEPTTDKFHAVMYGDERVVPGNALAVQADAPFTGLQKFGMNFLNRFEGSLCKCPILEKITFVDTPGILSGEKQKSRTYDFAQVVEWFAERVDRILLLFDAHKLDISDEFQGVLKCLTGHDDKIRCVLNKADAVDKQALLRVYGALMWSLGKIIKTPEVLRVYVGSFWDQPLRFTDNAELFEMEERDLLSDLRGLPRNSAVRKINELVKRARMLKVHCHVLNHLRSQFGFFGKQKMQEKLLKGLLDEFKLVQQKQGLPMGDFPHVGKFREKLEQFPIDKFPKLDEKLMEALDKALSVEIPKLMNMLPSADDKAESFEQGGTVSNPFTVDSTKSKVGGAWAVDGATKKKYDNLFYNCKLTNGKVSGGDARDVLLASKLGPDVLRGIWDLSDIDQDGSLDTDEFAVCMFLIDSINSGVITELPASLPVSVIPPTKRHLFDISG